MATKQTICAFSGFGGQGMLSVGKFVAEIQMANGKNVTWMPSYGAEMRGGTANCTVIYSPINIGAPIVTEGYDLVIAMNLPSVTKFQDKMNKGATMIINSDVVEKSVITNKDIKVIEVEATKLANEAGTLKAQNMVVLGALAAVSGDFGMEDMEKLIKKTFTGKKEKFVPMNMKAVELGMKAIKK